MQSVLKLVASLATAGAITLAMAGAANAQVVDAAFIQVVEGQASTPVGHAEFCKTRKTECGPNQHQVVYVELDQPRWETLLQVNAHFNDTIIPISDRELYGVEEFWTYPNGYGDCEDFVLAKRRALIDAGWPASTLLVTVVRELDGEGHAVLLVKTDRGDLVLDNQEGLIQLWSDTPYQFIKRQDQADSSRWVDMIDDRQIMVAASN
ncbi:hypothetical protein GCM10007989_05840 [Devosia pacifica]|uniref:Transglutaminase n=1 Tax=Devosia pacifica TaxID=1335967 RepID=A0A918VQ30_9HYPH|nr:transglutaminase-like cysteine peptidase [Devosia pacifica]GHA14020.1 hypothetical protein GCM10007989_05840 [Devosia pacifica]